MTKHSRYRSKPEVKAREILNQFPQGGYMTIVEQWRRLPDGQNRIRDAATAHGGLISQ
jgi:hypothetical protein